MRGKFLLCEESAKALEKLGSGGKGSLRLTSTSCHQSCFAGDLECHFEFMESWSIGLKSVYMFARKKATFACGGSAVHEVVLTANMPANFPRYIWITRWSLFFAIEFRCSANEFSSP